MAWKKRDEHPVSWDSLKGFIVPEIFQAPKTGGDPAGGWPVVHERLIRYFLRNVTGTPWVNHLALILAVLSARRQDVQTIRVTMMNFHVRLSDIFSASNLQTMEEWKPDRYLPLYVRGEIVPQDSQYTRQLFLTRYSSATRHVQNWLDALPAAEKLIYQGYVLPLPSQLLYEQLSKWKEVKQHQEDHRKAETAAVVPHFSEMRAEAHFRFNRLQRLRLAYRQALSEVLPDHSNLPLDFSYEEGDPPRARLHFRLWDRKSFVLHPEQVTAYVPSTREKARRGDLPYSDERNDVFLEFVKAETLTGDGLPEGFWFTDLLKMGLLGTKARWGNEPPRAPRYSGPDSSRVLRLRVFYPLRRNSHQGPALVSGRWLMIFSLLHPLDGFILAVYK